MKATAARQEGKKGRQGHQGRQGRGWLLATLMFLMSLTFFLQCAAPPCGNSGTFTFGGGFFASSFRR
jgi:hypothetical protein